MNEPLLYLQYHNCETQGTLPHAWTREATRVQIYTKVSAARQASGRVLLIAGIGLPRKYYLWSSFTIDRCHQKPDGYVHLEGPGWQLAPPQLLEGKAFQQFKTACANFIGFRSISALPYAQSLLKLAESHPPPGRVEAQLEVLQALRDMTKTERIKQVVDHTLAQLQSSGRAASGEPEMALSIRQPHAEAILRGIKKIEYRSSATSKRGRVLIYASRIPVDDIPYWMKYYGITDVAYDDLPRGVLVGSVEVYKCDGGEWYLRHPERSKELVAPKNRPQPIWFKPF